MFQDDDEIDADIEDEDEDLDRVVDEHLTKDSKGRKHTQPFLNQVYLNEKDLYDRRWPGRSTPLQFLLKIVLQYALGHLDTSDIAALARDGAIRRVFELFECPDILYDNLPKDRAFIRTLVPRDNLPPGYQRLTNGALYGRSTYPPNLVPAYRKQRLFIMDGSKTETGARDRQVTYFMRWNRVRFVFRRRLRKKGFTGRLSARLEDLSPREQFIWLVESHQARREVAREFHDLINGWNAYLNFQRIVKEAQEQGIPLKEHPKYHVYRLVPFNTIERMDHWIAARARAVKIPKERQDIHLFGGEGTQSLTEHTNAMIGLLDMASAVLHDPNLWVEEIPSDDENEHGIYVYIVHTEQGVYEVAYGFDSWRKTQSSRKVTLEIDGTVALALLRKDDAKAARNKWIFGNIPPMLLEELMFEDMDNRIILMGLADKPPSFELPDGVRIGGEHVESWGEHNEAVNFVRWWMIRTTRGKEVLFKKELTENVKLVQYEPDEIFWAYVDDTKILGIEAGNEQVYDEPGPGRRPVAVPTHLVSLPTNLLAVLLNYNFANQDLVNGTNNIAEACGYDVRMTCDGPESNLFRTLDLALEVWRQQPLENIKTLLDQRVSHLVEAGKGLELRREVTEFFKDLPVNRVVGTEVINGKRRDDMDLMDLYEDYLRLADQLHLAHIIWYSTQNGARIADLGDAKKAADGAICLYPTERLADRYPNDLWGRVDKPEEQFSPYTFAGQQKARTAILFLIYDGNMVVGAIKGLIDKLVIGVQPTVDQVYEEIIANLGTRRFYLKRVLNVLDLIEKHFYPGKLVAISRRWGIPIGKELIGGDKIASDAFKLMRKAIKIALKQGKDGPSEKVDLLGFLVVRDLIGEVKGQGGWVDAVQEGRLIAEIRSKLPGAS